MQAEAYGCSIWVTIGCRGAAHRHEGRIRGHALAAAAKGAVLRSRRTPDHHNRCLVSNAFSHVTAWQPAVAWTMQPRTLL